MNDTYIIDCIIEMYKGSTPNEIRLLCRYLISIIPTVATEDPLDITDMCTPHKMEKK